MTTLFCWKDPAFKRNSLLKHHGIMPLPNLRLFWGPSLYRDKKPVSSPLQTQHTWTNQSETVPKPSRQKTARIDTLWAFFSTSPSHNFKSPFIFTQNWERKYWKQQNTFFGIANSSSWRQFAMLVWNCNLEINAQLDFLKRALLQGAQVLWSTSESTTTNL